MRALKLRGVWWAFGTAVLIFALVGGAHLVRTKDRRRTRHSPDGQPQSLELDPERESARLLDQLRQEPFGPEPPSDGRPCDWPQYRGPLRDGVVRGVELLPDWSAHKPEIVWQAPCGGGYSSVAVAGGRAYLQDRPAGDNRERIRCLDADTGKEVWAYSYPADYSRLPGAGRDDGPLATPTVSEGRLYAVGALGQFICLDLNASKAAPVVAWEHDLIQEFEAELPVWGVACSPLIVDDLVIVQPGGRRGSIAAFELPGGKLRWASLEDVNGYSSPVLASPAGVRQVVAQSQGRLIGLRPDTGAHLWHYVWRESASLPLVRGDYAFITCDHGCALVKVEPDGGSLKARRVFECDGKLMASQLSTPVFRGGYVYGFHGDVHHHRGARLTCIDLRNPSEPRWQAEAVANGQVIRFDDLLFVQTQDGDLFLVKATPDGFQQLGCVKDALSGGRAWAAPSAVGNRVFLRDDKKAVCLDLPARPGRRSRGQN